MKISFNWLKQYIPTDLDAKEVSDMLTNCGLEVESTENFDRIKGGLKNIVVGKVLSCKKHPDADRLTITQVDTGGEKPLEIVCGAPNVQEGQSVLVALVGATLYPTNGEPFVIKKTKIRGVESEGMICAEDEMGLGTSHDGIMVLKDEPQTGLPASCYFNLEEDIVFEIGLTPNRSDAASHIGVARDLTALINLQKNQNNKLLYPDVSKFPLQGAKNPIAVSVENSMSCLRYTSLTITNVNVKASPDWLKNRLEAIGVRPINNVVDVTQYVLFELGQPLHAFDVDAIAGKKVIVKKAEDQTPFITLDKVERKLNKNDLMICNEQKPMCIAGVFGGEESSVTEKTTCVFLESACFNPVDIRKTAKYHGLKTDASFRYERGCDPNITIYAIKRAALLIQELAGGEISEITDFYPNPVSPRKITVNYSYLNNLTGKTIPKETVKKVLSAIEIAVLNETEQDITLAIPTNKVDVTRQADVIEEFLRIYGYNNIEIATRINYETSLLHKNPLIKIQNTLSDYLSSNGFYETMNNSLTKSDYAKSFGFIDAQQTVTLLNPLSKDLQNMRQTLLFNSLENVIHNINHGTTDIKLYEFGNVYYKNPAANQCDDVTKRFQEEKHLAICVSGKKQAESWKEQQTDVDFYYLKNIVCNAMKRINISLDNLKTATQTATASMNTVLQYLYQDVPFVTIGEVNDKLLNFFDIKQSVFYADIHCELFVPLSENKRTVYEELNRFPEVSRDLALLIDKQITYQEIEQLAFKTERKQLKSVNLFDVYEGKNLEDGKKSYAVRFILFNKEKTLTNNEINHIMDKLIAAFEKELGAKLR
ncbi:MAG: phenylalanine--tRNA ligase subunit beta [Bacteroidales bacterium]|jgi:phenylalanyl-tRNA synthetase beta chain|nr:phenylalanine--tRNA ligase subunit beta [Bacteroidales bacterium]